MRSFYTYGKSAEGLLKSVTDEISQIEPGKSRAEANQEMLKNDLKKFNFKPDSKLHDCGFTVDVKKGLYRFPSILLFDLSILWRISGCSSWETADNLLSAEKISAEFHEKLTFLLASACYIRLSAYLHHDSHDDRISILQEDERSNNIIHTDNSSSSRWFVPQELFNIYCEIMVPMKRHFANGQNRALQDLLTTKLENSSWHTKFITLHCCHRWQEVWKLLDVQFCENVVLGFQDKIITELIGLDISLEEVWQSVKALSYTLYQKREYKAALTYHKTVTIRQTNLPICASILCGASALPTGQDTRT